jgi:hypothetical protein
MSNSADLERIDVVALEEVQNRLVSSLIKSVTAGGLLAPKDWVQGGWSRGKAAFSDKIEFGLRKEALPGG